MVFVQIRHVPSYYYYYLCNPFKQFLYAGTKFPMYKVWWLREASQIEQTFIPLC